MYSERRVPILATIVVAAVALAGCANEGDDIYITETQSQVIDASQVSDDYLADLEVVSEVTSVTVASPPVVTFTLETVTGIPIVGITPFWEADHRFVRFTFAKLVPTPTPRWVSYVRDGDEPDYDSGASLVDHGDGSYTFTFNTDVTAVAGVPYEPTLTHRLAGQLGSGSVSLQPQNYAYDFVPGGGMITQSRDVAVMESCNECHDDLAFHGRRFMVEYCVTCHNQDLAMGEGNFSHMIHRIHSAGDFAVLDGGVSYAEVTYPQSLANCRKCHTGSDALTPDGDNWKVIPNRSACFGCHDQMNHPGYPATPIPSDDLCILCHTPEIIEGYHVLPNATPNNPNLLAGQLAVSYDLMAASVDDGGTEDITILARILDDGTPLDASMLPMGVDLNNMSFLLAWALPQDGMDEPMDYNNIGRRAAQPKSVSLSNIVDSLVGTHSYDAMTGVNTFVITSMTDKFPTDATLRAVGMQGYMSQTIGLDDVSLHTPSAVVAITGDDERRTVVDSAKCSSCHEWFEGHGGSRTYNIQICTLCHVPNLSSTGRTVTDPTARGLDLDLDAAVMSGILPMSVIPNDPLTYPEDAQSLKSLIHGIHSSGFRTVPFQHVRGPSRQGFYDWDEVTFPRGASTQKCSLCHDGDTYAIPLPAGVLPTTVRTTQATDGMDFDVPAVETAFVEVPSDENWIHSPVAASCVGCHTDLVAWAHMELNGAQLSDPNGSLWSNRSDLVPNMEACQICHGPGRIADVEAVHNR